MNARMVRNVVPSGPVAGAARRLVRALAYPSCYPHPCGAIELVETHLSWVLLTGDFAYKIKKPVNLGFVDFTTLERRRYFCDGELRLNRRLAPHLYLDVVPITGAVEAPRMGGPGPAIEYAVRMVQFPQDRLAAQQWAAGRLEGRHLDALAADVAHFQERIPQAPAAGHYGEPDRVHLPVRQNFEQLRDLLPAGVDRNRLERLARWSEQRFAELRVVLGDRRRNGRVREGHGDLHLGNMALLDGRLVMFDCIEFNPEFRWIETASEVAFVVMDLLQRGATAFAHRFLNAWLEASGDYEALQVLDYFLVYRAVVRAKVAAIRASQVAAAGAAAAAALAEARAYLKLAGQLSGPRQAALLITHGLSGSGKSTLSEALVERLGMVRMRSDVERKRLFGLEPVARTAAGLGQGLYAAAVTDRTYAVLEQRAATVLQAGYMAIVDATFLRRDQRAKFAALAARLDCPFAVVSFEARPGTLRQRVAARAAAGPGVSEATPAVVDAQREARQPVDASEQVALISIDTEAASARECLVAAVSAWRAAQQPRNGVVPIGPA